jgi:hypothetical protein
MKNIFLIAPVFALCCILPACEMEGDSLLDKKESGDLTEEIVFSTSKLTKEFLTNVYYEIPFGYDHPNQQYWIDGITDDGAHRPLNAWSKGVHLGAFGPTNIPAKIQRWQKCYSMIRACNKFMEKIESVPLDPEGYISTPEVRTRMKFEAQLLRALFYAELLKWYGGVPIITKVLDVDSPELYTPRANLQEMKDFIFSELDIASSGLPEEHADFDKPRVNPSVAEVIKCRVLLQLASPLFNSDRDAFGNPTELCPWSWGNYSADRWKEAADAAKKFMDKGKHSLHVSDGSRLTAAELRRITTPATRNSYGFYEYDIVYRNPQLIMWYPKKSGSTNETTKFCVPHTMQSEKTQSGATLPTMNFVGAFSTLNGIQIYEMNDDGSYKTDDKGEFIIRQEAIDDGFDPQNPYANRDNRFYHSVYYNGIRHNNVEYEIWRSPADGTYGREYNETFNHTGFFLRRHNDPFKVYPNTNRTSTIGGTSTNTFPLFHYGEVLLAYAEAQNEYLPENESRNGIIAVMDLFRARADMPDVTTTFARNGWDPNSKTDMRTFIRNERRIELAFELHRPHDVRRWKTGEGTQRLIYGQDVVKDKNNNTYTYGIEIIQRRAFEAKHYLWPIPQAEIANNPQMIQNPGWGVL